MLETIFAFGAASVMKASLAESRSRDALVLFPGFPGLTPGPGSFNGPPKMRVALAKAVLPLGGLDAFLPGYEGHSPPGKFRFESAVVAGSELVLELAARGYERVHVAGHSFGAFVAFNAHRALGPKGGKLALLSGLLDLPDENAVRAFLPYYHEHFPEILGRGPEARAGSIADLERARRAGNPLSLAAPKTESELLIVHGRLDEEVSVDQSRRFHARAGGRLVISDADHGYTGKLPALADEFRRFITPSR